MIKADAAFIEQGAEKVDSRFELNALVATLAGARQMGLAAEPTAVRQIQGAVGEDFETLFEADFAADLVKAKRAYLPIGPDRLRAIWLVDVPESDDRVEWMVDATLGYVIEQRNYKIEDSFHVPGHSHEVTRDQSLAPSLFIDSLGLGGPQYEVFPPPMEYPDDGPRVIVSNPANQTASPFGWHDENGAADGGTFTTTRGNNTHTFLDRNNDRAPDEGVSLDGGVNLDFTGSLVPLNLNLGPDANQAAAAVNLFFWTNYLHDILYLYGFNETAGNYQNTNNGGGPGDGDPVLARAQAEADRPTLNNATFLITTDGVPAFMNMYVWNYTTPRRDGSFSNMIIAHEYAHGLSTRLTGGRTEPNCLRNTEQMGEGWSDFVGLVLTAKASDTRTTSRGVGTYVQGEDANGQGIRPAPYTTDMQLNGATYEDLPGATIPHGVGYIWATMLWELYWDLVDAHGFEEDFTAGWQNGGNNLALQLVIDGMKLQSCLPGFVEGRNAILQADQNLTGGANQCLIWEAFARRGLGFSASEGFSGSTTDGFASYDMPETCSFGAFRGNDREVCAGADKTFDFGIGGLWSGTVSASLVDAPQGAEFSLNETTFTEFPALVRLTVANSSGLISGNYSVTLRLDDGETQRDFPFNFQVISATPTPVTLKLPSSEERNVSYLPLFSWDDSSEGVEYTVEVSLNERFSDIVLTGRTNTTVFQTETPLRVGIQHYWRVISSNSCGQVVSEGRGFITQGAPDIPAQLFEGEGVNATELQNRVLIFSPNSNFSEYESCIEEGDGEWNYSTENATVIEGFGDEDARYIPLPQPFNFYGVNYNDFILMSNGFITFGSNDPTGSPSTEDIERHFTVPRIAFFWDDLDPGSLASDPEPGIVSYEILDDRVVVTFQNVTEWVPLLFQPKPVNVQVELFFDDGRIRMTYLDIAPVDCLVGLSDGRPIPNGGAYNPARFDQSETCDFACPYDATRDPNTDNAVDLQDLIYLNLVWHDDASVADGAREANDYNEDSRFNVLDLTQWINQTGSCFILSSRL
ncbi:M36 family metallopeptidase [Acanthopleuribacter pedis]|uniref:M36 family metallopeptidase n=1 Tax=Acanthopleuribacter pedis TaxID=442870 RepID=UPI00311CDE48